MTFDTSFIQTTYLITIIMLLISIMILSVYFSHKLKKQRAYYEDNKRSNSIKKTPRKTLLKTSNTSSGVPVPPKNTLPYTTKKPFKKTPNITLDDFGAFKGTRILIVEDNKLNQKILLSVLQKSGINITIANHGKEALDFLFKEEKIFDLILMDISMPVMDGYATTQAIRKDKRFDTLPIVTFTAFQSGEEIEKMYTFGANGHLIKPLNSLQLFTAFTIYLGNIQKNISITNTLKVKGLDVQHGIMIANNNEEEYKQQLREFVLFYSHMIKSIPLAIEKNDEKHLQMYIMQISNILAPIGAYELDKIVARMKKIFIYSTEHRMEEFKDLFPQTLQQLIKAINLYLTHDS